MTKQYIGVKKVTAWPQEKDGKEGYAVKYEDGYVSWSPKDVFERAYFPLADPQGSKILRDDVERFLFGGGQAEGKIGQKTTILSMTTLSGFEMHETSSCVDPANYSQRIGVECCKSVMVNKMFGHLGFALQWANSGLGRQLDEGESIEASQ